MCSLSSRMCSLLRVKCSVFGGARLRSRPPSAGLGQVSEDAGMTGMCPLCQANVSSSEPDVSSFGPDVSTFRPNVSTLAGQVSVEVGERAGGRAVRRTRRKSRSLPSAGSPRTGAEDGRVGDAAPTKEEAADAGKAEDDEDGWGRAATRRVFHKSPNLVLRQAQEERHRFRAVREKPVEP